MLLSNISLCDFKLCFSKELVTFKTTIGNLYLNIELGPRPHDWWPIIHDPLVWIWILISTILSHLVQPFAILSFVWVGNYFPESVQHSPDFQQWMMKFCNSVLWVGELCNSTYPTLHEWGLDKSLEERVKFGFNTPFCPVGFGIYLKGSGINYHFTVKTTIVNRKI